MSKANTYTKKATILAKKLRKTVAFFLYHPAYFKSLHLPYQNYHKYYFQFKYLSNRSNRLNAAAIVRPSIF